MRPRNGEQDWGRSAAHWAVGQGRADQSIYHGGQSRPRRWQAGSAGGQGTDRVPACQRPEPFHAAREPVGACRPEPSLPLPSSPLFGFHPGRAGGVKGQVTSATLPPHQHLRPEVVTEGEYGGFLIISLPRGPSDALVAVTCAPRPTPPPRVERRGSYFHHHVGPEEVSAVVSPFYRWEY